MSLVLDPVLREQGWCPRTRQALAGLLRDGAGRGLPVALDFDNTLVSGDIGEATLAVLVRDRTIDATKLSPELLPAFRSPHGSLITWDAMADLTAYYEALLAPTLHGPKDPTPLASGYVWAVEVMAGLTPWQVVEATRTAYAEAVPGQERWITVTPGLTAYLAPFFYPEMVELVAQLLLHKSDVWIVSASNVWSVRWMVQYGLNPRLRSLGVSTGLAADHVLGVATLLSDEAGHLYKDSVRVRENPAYAALQEPELSRLHLTSRLQFPVPIYSGKIACLWEVLPVRPWLAAGDSPGDHALLRYSEHRLWLARLEKLAYQQATWDLLRRTGGEGWMVQPVLAHTTPGFLSEPVDLARWSGDSSSKVRASLELLQSPPMPAIW